jgi:hypothetical protein
VGVEDNDSNRNWNYSRSLLFTLAEPTYHTGARLTFDIARSFAAALIWTNGWNANFIGNGFRSVAGAVSWKPAAGVDLSATYIAGPEPPPFDPGSADLVFRHALNANASVALGARATAALTFDAAFDSGTFGGVGGYVRVRVLPFMYGTARGEIFTDPDGRSTGIKQTLGETTATLAMTTRVASVDVLARVEYRWDVSTARSFPGPRSTQNTLAVSVVVSF